MDVDHPEPFENDVRAATRGELSRIQASQSGMN